MTTKITLFGDSITAGWQEPNETTILKDLLAGYLVEVGKTNVEIILKGVPGDDTDKGMSRIQAVADTAADVYVVFFGANDAATNREIHPDQFEENLVAMAIKLGMEKVIFVTPPYHNDALDKDKRKNSLVETYRERTIEAAKKVGAPVIDLYKQMTAYPVPNEFLQKDGLHFSQYGYELLASLYAIYLRDRI